MWPGARILKSIIWIVGLKPKKKKKFSYRHDCQPILYFGLSVLRFISIQVTYQDYRRDRFFFVADIDFGSEAKSLNGQV